MPRPPDSPPSVELPAGLGGQPPPLPDQSAGARDGTAQLTGWRLWLAWAGIAGLVAWGVVLYAISVPITLDVFLRAEPPFQAIHVNAEWEGPGVPVGPQRGGVAERAGMPAGRLVAVDGRPVAEDATILDAGPLAAGPIGDPVRLSVATAAGDTVTVSVVRTDALAPEFEPFGMGWIPLRLLRLAIEMVLILILFGVAFVLLLRRGRSVVALVGAGAFLTMGLLQGPLGIAKAVLGAPLTFALFDHLFTPLLLTFLVLFPDGQARPRWSWWIPLAGGVVSMGVVVESALLPLLGLLFVLAIAAQVRRYRDHASQAQRLQTKWAFLGLTAGVAFASVGVALFVAPEPLDPTWRWSRGLLAQGLFSLFGLAPLGVLLSLLRYRLWDAEAAWSKSAMAAALTLALTAIVAGGTALTQAALGTSGPLAIGLATAAAAVFFVPLQRRLGDWADHRFLRDLTDLKERLPQLVGHLRETESIEGIAKAVTDRVVSAVHATHVALVVPDGEGWATVGVEGIDASSAEAWAAESELATPPDLKRTRRHLWLSVVWRQPEDRLFPVRVALRAERGGGELATEGWLVLGPRPDGSGYGPDDLEAVAEIAGPVGRALQVVRVREGLEAERRAELAQALAERDEQLNQRLGLIEALLSP